MKKNYFAISSVILLLVLSFITYKIYETDEIQQDTTLRSDAEHDTQIKNNEMMAVSAFNKIKDDLNNNAIKDTPKSQENANNSINSETSK